MYRRPSANNRKGHFSTKVNCLCYENMFHWIILIRFKTGLLIFSVSLLPFCASGWKREGSQTDLCWLIFCLRGSSSGGLKALGSPPLRQNAAISSSHFLRLMLKRKTGTIHSHTLLSIGWVYWCKPEVTALMPNHHQNIVGGSEDSSAFLIYANIPIACCLLLSLSIDWFTEICHRVPEKYC